MRSALALAGASALIVGAMAAPALADTDVPVYGGTTTVTVTQKALPKITHAGIVMKGVDGATDDVIAGGADARQLFDFPITTPSNLRLEDNATGGKIGEVTGGRVAHLGSIKFINTNKGKAATVGDFIVNFKAMKVMATRVNGDKVDAIAVFKIVPVDPPIMPKYDKKVDPTTAKVSGLNLKMTDAGAGALNDLLKTNFFKGGFNFGKASTLAELVAP